MAATASNKYKFRLASGDIDWDSDTFKVTLMDTGFTFDQDADEHYDDVSGDELPAGNGYTAGGVVWTNIIVTESDANNRAEVTGDNAQWTAAGGTIGPAAGVIIYKDTGTPATSTVVGYFPFAGGDQSAGNGTNFTVSAIQVNHT
jgi:hypothetical protein